MTSFALFSGVSAGQSLTDSETGYIGRDAVVNGYISGSGDGIDLRIDGLLYYNGVSLNLSGADFTLYVGRTGSIQAVVSAATSYAAVEFLASNGAGAGIGRLFNSGEISGDGMAIFARANDADDVARISNSGSMMGETDGIFVTGAGKVVIANSGLIEGFRNAISNEFFGLTDTQLVLTNSGVIRGGIASIQVGGAADKVVNVGRIEGEVRLGAGNDTLDTRGGMALDAILLQEGDDRFFGNAAWHETVDGGDGLDILDFRSQASVTLALDDSFGNGGAALGDSYDNFEVVLGSNGGNDKLRGDSGVNVLGGYAGKDVLDGAGGLDTLSGGTGADTLTGGLGSDSFQYSSINDFGDKILDFSSAASGNNDKFEFVASELGGGLVAGALAPGRFQSRPDNVAQDTNDRFIFRTTDKTLWFDIDGDGAQAAVMVADLQASATMTSADIVLI